MGRGRGTEVVGISFLENSKAPFYSSYQWIICFVLFLITYFRFLVKPHWAGNTASDPTAWPQVSWPGCQGGRSSLRTPGSGARAGGTASGPSAHPQVPQPSLSSPGPGMRMRGREGARTQGHDGVFAY